MSNLANALRLQDKLEQAAKLYAQAHKGLQGALGERDRETLRRTMTCHMQRLARGALVVLLLAHRLEAARAPEGGGVAVMCVKAGSSESGGMASSDS